MIDDHEDILIKSVEAVSERIQILALNIAVAAAKMSYRQQLTGEVNTRLSQLVHQATKAVKNMNQVLSAAKANLPAKDYGHATDDDYKISLDQAKNIEAALVSIIDDSQKIMELLGKVKQR